ncbi:MAG TPA: hypothetical protein VGC90_02800 [Candidatus Limnocylindrales bacterium]
MTVGHLPFAVRRPAADQPTSRGGGFIRRTFGTVLLLVIFAAIAWSYFSQPKSAQPACPNPGQPCVVPPRQPTGAPALHLGTVWQSSELGFAVEYSPSEWQAGDQDARGIRLDLAPQAVSGMGFDGGQVLAIVRGVPSSEASPEQLVTQEVDLLRQNVPDIEVDAQPAHAILGPEIGYQPGIGKVYAGTTDGSAGGAIPVSASILASTDGRISTMFVLVVVDPGAGSPDGTLLDAARHVGDSLVNAVTWPAP